MTIQAGYRVLYAHFRFQVFIEGIQGAAFRKASGLELDVDEMLYAEGGAFCDYKEPGKIKFADIVLERGVSEDVRFYDWVMDVVDVMAKLPGGVGKAPAKNYMKRVTIRQLDRDDKPVYDHVCEWCWPKKFVAGEWDNMSSEVTIESLTLATHHWYREKR
jgi:phage tail-like protein